MSRLLENEDNIFKSSFSDPDKGSSRKIENSSANISKTQGQKPNDSKDLHNDDGTIFKRPIQTFPGQKEKDKPEVKHQREFQEQEKSWFNDSSEPERDAKSKAALKFAQTFSEPQPKRVEEDRSLRTHYSTASSFFTCDEEGYGESFFLDGIIFFLMRSIMGPRRENYSGCKWLLELNIKHLDLEENLAENMLALLNSNQFCYLEKLFSEKKLGAFFQALRRNLNLSSVFGRELLENFSNCFEIKLATMLISPGKTLEVVEYGARHKPTLQIVVFFEQKKKACFCDDENFMGMLEKIKKESGAISLEKILKMKEDSNFIKEEVIEFKPF